MEPESELRNSFPLRTPCASQSLDQNQSKTKKNQSIVTLSKARTVKKKKQKTILDFSALKYIVQERNTRFWRSATREEIRMNKRTREVMAPEDVFATKLLT
jgi:hypothetical protein